VNAERLDDGERAIRVAMRLNPIYPVNYLAVLADALVNQGRGEEALEVLATLIERNPKYISAHLHLAGLYGAGGNIDAARSAISEVLRINPAYRLGMARRFYLSSDKDRQERFLEALRMAGLPE
jgi:tetratricopeptide (TPR) repeat protein